MDTDKPCACCDEPGQADHIRKLEDELNELAGGDALFWASSEYPADMRESDLEDILEFESIGSGISLLRDCSGTALNSAPGLDGAGTHKFWKSFTRWRICAYS
jgi:hypothetical protein